MHFMLRPDMRAGRSVVPCQSYSRAEFNANSPCVNKHYVLRGMFCLFAARRLIFIAPNLHIIVTVLSIYIHTHVGICFPFFSKR
jgi:hypothetical protein